MQENDTTLDIMIRHLTENSAKNRINRIKFKKLKFSVSRRFLQHQQSCR